MLTVSGHDRVAAVENVHGEGVYTVVTNQVSSRMIDTTTLLVSIVSNYATVV